jgi:hypothetical protein
MHAAVLMALCNTPKAFAQFTNVSELLNISTSVPTTYNGNGVSFYDFNDDGWDDITIARGNEDPVFLTNNDGTLETAPFTIPNNGGQQISMILWADYDGDEDVDLIITKWEGPVELWQNDGDFNFTNVAAAAGLNTGNYRHVGAAFADIDHDGDIDLYIAKFYHPAFYTTPQYAGAFYTNNGDGTFSESTVSTGVYVAPRPIFQPIFLDFDGDGWEDLYLITDRVFSENALFKNDGDGTFTNVSEGSGADIMIDSMTGTVGDYDNDSDLDIYITNSPPNGSKFLENNGDETFTEVAAALGVNVTQIGWGSLWIDYDNDSWQDLFVSLTGGTQTFPGNYFYRNNEGNSFTNMALELGLRDEITETYVCAGGDINNDGYFDILLNNKLGYLPLLYQNDGGDNNYISVSLRGVVSNRDGTGTWIRCHADGNEYVRYTLCGENLIGQNANRYIFGLGETATIDSLVVEWNMGTRDVYYDLDSNQHILAVEGITAYDGLTVSGSDAFLCEGGTLGLSVGEFEAYLWSTGETTPEITITEPGTYAAEVLIPGGVWIPADTIFVEWAPVFEIVGVTSNETCFGVEDGTIELLLEPGTYASLMWPDNSNDIIRNDLAPGAYQVELTDNYGCLHTESFVIEAAIPLSTIASLTNVLCYGDSTGQAEIAVFGGVPPYQLDWNGADPTALPAGEHATTVVDSQGCDSIFQFEIGSADSISVELDITNAPTGGTGAVSVFISGGITPYSILWSNGDAESTEISGLIPGSYWVLVTDANGCEKLINFEVEALLRTTHSITGHPFRIVPNPVLGESFQIQIEGNPGLIDVEMYDLTGKLIFSFQNHDTDLPFECKGMKPGIYLVKIHLNGRIHALRMAKL